MFHMTAANAVAAAQEPITGPEVRAHAHTLFADSLFWVRTNWIDIVIAIAVAAAIWALLYGVRRAGMRLCREASPTDRSWRTIAGRVIARTGNFFIVMTSARLVVGYADAPVSIAATVAFLFTIAAVFQAAIWARELILGAIEHRAVGEDKAALGTALGLIRVLVTFALFAIALIVVLDNLGVNVTGLVAGLGVGGIAIGLAAQGIFADLFAALAIIFDRPFRLGETISYDQTSGTVEEIGLKSTRIRASTGEQRVISNKHLLDREIQNITERSYRRVTFVLGLVRSTPAATMRGLPDMLREIVEAHDQRFVHAGFMAFGTQSFDFQLEFDTGPAFAEWYAARHAIGLAIVERFEAEGIALAYPTQLALTPAGDDDPVAPNPAEAAKV
jgi:small-conductance mechanosensitive channel